MRVTRYREGVKDRARDALVIEEPLETRLSWVGEDGEVRTEPLAVTMRTPGEDFELVAGFLHGEGVVSEAEDLAGLTYCRGDRAQEYNTVEARLRPGVPFDAERMRRNFYATSSCGVCGKASLDAVTTLGCTVLPDGPRVSADLLPELPDLLRARQEAFDRTGGLHAAGLFQPDGSCLDVREDVGRHNAVDKVLGAAFLARRLPASETILVVSGRASFELVQKAVMAGVPIMVAVGAPSTLAVELANRFGHTLVGFARNGGCNVYAGEARVA
ncbi:MAG: formate dehydrogenase accessory sulfurtransferase FdhD [Gemmatimonadota bacterium]|nr:formate dehydrogenase accessory sulfurtransferase FdhD [Gemmatimonadota bacterium]